MAALVSVFAYFLASDNSTNANQMHLSIHSQPPGFECLILELPTTNFNPSSSLKKLFMGDPNPSSEWPISSYRIEKEGVAVTSFSYDGYGEERFFPLSDFGVIQPEKLNHFISHRKFWLGTDAYGRDVLSRLIIGTRISFSIGFIAVIISLIIGISVGAIGGYFGGRTDAIVMWLINVTWSIPTLLLVIAVSLALGKGIWQVFLAVGLTMWVEVARVVRGQVISTKHQPYVAAAKVLGFSDFRILFRHILPNIMAPIIVIATANFASAILIESGLSFLGIGAQPPIPSWGSMIKDHYQYIVLGKAYLALVPGVAIMLLVLSFMLLGNALRDIMDLRK